LFSVVSLDLFSFKCLWWFLNSDDFTENIFHAPIIIDYMHICFLSDNSGCFAQIQVVVISLNLTHTQKKCHISSQKQKGYFRIIQFLSWQQFFMTSVAKLDIPMDTLSFCTVNNNVLVMITTHPDEVNKT